MAHYSARKGNRVLSYTTTWISWINMEFQMLSVKSKKPDSKGSLDTESRLVVLQDWEG